MSALPHAFATDGRASAIPIALWACDFAPGKGKERYTLRFAPIVGAYVACIAVSRGRASSVPDEDAIRYGRTNEVGWLVGTPDNAPGDPSPVPAAPRVLSPAPAFWFLDPNDPGPVAVEIAGQSADPDLIHGLPNEHYRIFWTYDRALFDIFVEDLQRDTASALLEWRVPSYEMAPFGAPQDLGRMDLLSEGELDAAVRLLFPAERTGYHAGQRFSDRCTAAIFDATPETFRRLFLCEWLGWCSQRFLADERHWPYLWRLRSVILAAQAGAPLPDLERLLPGGGVMAKRAQEMRGYVHALARAGQRARQPIARVLNVQMGSPSWEYEIAALEERRGVAHPAKHVRNADEFFFTEAQRLALLAYFDMYAAGFRHAPDFAALDAHAAHIDEVVGWVSAKQQRLLAQLSDFVLRVDVGRCLQDDAARLALIERATAAWAVHGVRHWELADAALKTQSDWDKLARQLKWLSVGGKLLAKSFEALHDFLTLYVHGSAQSVETLVRYLYRYDLALRHQRIEQTLPIGRGVLRLEYDPGSGRAQARLYRAGKKLELGSYELLTQVVSAPSDEASSLGGSGHPPKHMARMRRALRQGQVREFVLLERFIDVPGAEVVGGMAELIANAVSLLKAGMALGALADDLKGKSFSDGKVTLYFEAGTETLQALTPATKLMAYPLRKALKDPHRLSGLVQVSEGLGKVGASVAAVQGFVTSATTLSTFLRPETSTTDLGNYLARGETTAAWLETTKSVVQVAVSTGEAVEVLGIATTLASVPMGACLAVGGVAILTLEFAIWTAAGGERPMDEFLNAVRDARIAQFTLSSDDRVLEPRETVPSPVPGAPAKSCASRLAKRFGALNAVAKVELGARRVR